MSTYPPSHAAPDVSTADGLLRFGNLFCDAKILLTAVELGVFAELDHATATEPELAARLKLHGRGLRDFLQALVSIGVLHEQEGSYRNAIGAANHLVAGRPGYVGGFLLGAGLTLYPAYNNLAQALRTGRKQSGGDFADLFGNPEALAGFTEMMDGLNDVLGRELAKVVDWSRHKRVLDVGGCRGNVLSHILKAQPGLTGRVFDLPAMGPLFDRHMNNLGLADRAGFTAGDFFADELPAANVMIYGHVLSDWSREQRKTLLAKAFTALAPGGTLLVYDRILGARGDDRENLVASLNMLLVTDGGGEYTVTELAEDAAGAGFGSVTHGPLGAYDTLVTCSKNRGTA